MQATLPTFDAGLESFSVSDLCHPARLTEAVVTKLNLMPPGRLAHERLEQGVRLMLEMIRNAVCGQFRELPLTTLADFLEALHYFLKWRDRRPDTWEGGYMDDLEVTLQALNTHERVVAAYRSWLTSQGTHRIAPRTVSANLAAGYHEAGSVQWNLS
jgi:hypothetical protein